MHPHTQITHQPSLGRTKCWKFTMGNNIYFLSTKCWTWTSRAAPLTKKTSRCIESGAQNHSEHKFCSSLPEPHSTPPQSLHTHTAHTTATRNWLSPTTTHKTYSISLLPAYCTHHLQLASPHRPTIAPTQNSPKKPNHTTLAHHLPHTPQFTSTSTLLTTSHAPTHPNHQPA